MKILKFHKAFWHKHPSYLTEGEESWPKCELYVNYSESLERDGGKRRVTMTATFTLFNGNIGKIIGCERFSCLKKLLKVICYVKWFIQNLKASLNFWEGISVFSGKLIMKKMNEARFYWCKYEEDFIISENFLRKTSILLIKYYNRSW